jgi:hypothetical protein
VVGHVPFGVGLTNVLKSGIASIEHLRGYVYKLIPEAPSHSLGWDKRSRFLVWSLLDPERIGKAVQATAAAGSTPGKTAGAGGSRASTQSIQAATSALSSSPSSLAEAGGQSDS